MSEPTHCPKCNADFKGEPIPKKHRHMYSKTHFSRLIGISDGDSVGLWKCPDCGHEWDRAGAFAAMARKNIRR